MPHSDPVRATLPTMKKIILALLILYPLTALALINPQVQPRNLFDQYNMVLGLEVTKVDSKTLTITANVVKAAKGESPGETITLKASDKKNLNEILSISEGQTLVAFAGRNRPRSRANDVLYYIGGGTWHTAQMTRTPGEWDLTGNADEGKSGAEIFFGVFNGAVEQLWAMAQDLAADRAYYPASPFTAFEAMEITKLDGPVRGVALFDIDSDGDLDIVATSDAGNRVFIRDADGSYKDATAERGLTETKSRSVALADADGDGDADILLNGILYQADAGVWKKTDRIPAKKDVLSAAFAELNGDGFPDVIASLEGGGLAAFLNPGEAGKPFEDATESMALPTEGNGYFDTGDWNGDGLTDILYASGEGLLLIQEGGKFNAETLGEEGEEYEFGAAVMAPIVSPDKTAAYLTMSDGKMLFDSSDEGPRDILRYGNEIQDDLPDLWMPLAEDLNADGTIDLYTTTLSEGSPNFFVTNRGYGSFMMEEKYAGGKIIPPAVYNRPAWGIAAGDATGDGANDLLTGAEDGSLILLVNTTLKNRPEKAEPSTLLDGRKQIAARIATIVLTGKKGIVGAKLELLDKDSRLVGSRRIGGNTGIGCSGPQQVSLAVREPGLHSLKVTFSDGTTATQEVDLSATQPRHQRIEISSKEN